MRLPACLALAAAVIAGAAAAATPHVTLQGGDVAYVGADGVTHVLTHDGGYSDPALAPDGHTLAFIHTDAPAASAADDPQTSLWIADGATGAARRLIGPQPANDPAQDFASFSGPVFSLDGGFVYVTAMAWATSGAVHEVSVATGQQHFVIDGGVQSVIRTGPWRGYLLVQRHMYYPAPKEGSYDPVYVVRPDAKQTFLVPGTDKDEGASVGPWLKKNGWVAW